MKLPDTGDTDALLKTFVECVKGVTMDVDDKAEVVINLAKAWALDDKTIQHALRERLGDKAADHPYFYWKPSPVFSVGAGVRVIDGAPQAQGQRGRVTAIDTPRRLGARGMSRSFFYTVVLDQSAEPWGFKEEQLEPWKL
ncbi:MAG: hypothetical protein GY822_26910 [Deltaproteobacteria bacterium]|nr:hypothetical protein [Deltaproteobacteria bacterium]